MTMPLLAQCFRRVRDVTEVEIKMLRAQAAKYVKVQTEFRDL